MNSKLLKEAFSDIILGNGVKRTVHALEYAGADYSDLFIECLQKHAFDKKMLKEVTIEVGYRIPGFWINDSMAWFGHLFWEVFSDKRKRKIWGSVVRNEKGDWKYIYPGNSSHVVYLNTRKVQAVDIYHLT